MTIPGAGGQVPPRPDQAYQGGGGVVIAPGSSNIVRATQVVVFGTGAGTGLFVYNGTPALGNSPIFQVVSPGVTLDPFGNAVQSLLNAGSLAGGHFGIGQDGTVFIANSAGKTVIRIDTATGSQWFYNSSGEGLGNLIASIAPAAGTDRAGNAYVQGVAAYVTISGTKYAIRLGAAGASGTIPGFFSDNLASPAFASPSFGPSAVGPGGCSAEVASGQGVSTSVAAGIFAQDSTLSGIVNGLVSMICGQVQLGNSGAAVWNDNTQQLNLPAGGGPFILAEGFHTLSNPAGITGTCRIKKLPWNMIWLEGEVTWSGTAGATLTFGAPPDSTYSPATALHRDVASTATPSAVSNPGRLFIPTAGGGPQLITPTVTGANTSWGWSVTYPNN